MGFYISQAINETYYGKSNELLAAEKQLGKFRNKYIGEVFTAEANQDEDLMKFNKLMEKATGFNPFCLTVIPNSIYNAFTFPVGIRFDTNVNKHIRVTKSNIKVDPKAEFCLAAFITKGLIFSPNFTDGEIFAILLHEIGHNYSGGIIPEVGYFDVFKKVYGVVMTICTLGLDSVLFSNGVMKAARNIGDAIMKIPAIRFVANTLHNVLSLLSSLGTEGRELQNLASLGSTNITAILQGIFYTLMYDPASILFSFIGYADEGFADQFAAINGYGPELASGLNKMEYNSPSAIRTISNQIPILNALLDIPCLIATILIIPFDPHPLTPQRLTNCKKALEIELNKNKVDPRVKSRILKDINNMEKEIKNNTQMNDEITDPYMFRKLYYSVMQAIAGGDIRHFIFRFASPENVDKNITKKINGEM